MFLLPRSRTLAALAWLLLAAVYVSPGMAAIPSSIGYQGFLTDSAGVPIEGSETMTFRLYSSVSGGTAAWTESQTVTLSKGVFAVQLGAQTALGVPFDVPYFLGIQVGSDPEMTPRTPFASTPYALRAKTVETDQDTLADLPCVAGQVAKRTASGWSCAADEVGSGDISSVAAGAGLEGGGTAGAVSLGVAPAGVTASMIGTGQVVKGINGLTDSVQLVQGANVTLTAGANNSLVIAAAGAGAVTWDQITGKPTEFAPAGVRSGSFQVGNGLTVFGDATSALNVYGGAQIGGNLRVDTSMYAADQSGEKFIALGSGVLLKHWVTNGQVDVSRVTLKSYDTSLQDNVLLQGDSGGTLETWDGRDNNKLGVRVKGRSGLTGGGIDIYNGLASVPVIKLMGYKTDSPYQADAVISVTGAVLVNGNAVNDYAEVFELSDSTRIAPGMVVSMDTEHPGQLTLSTSAYDHKVAGVISGAGEGKPGFVLGERRDGSTDKPLAVAGVSYCLAEADSNPIETGDLLTTSDLPGHAMKAGDPMRAQGAVLGKAMQPLAGGRGLILVLVTLQ